MIFCLIILAISCNKDDDGSPVDRTGSIFITVRFNGQIVGGAVVSTEPVSTTVETDMTGTALLNNIPVGGYKVKATHPDIGSGAASVSVTEDEAMDVIINLIGGVFENPSADIYEPFDNDILNLGEPIEFIGAVNDEKDAKSSLSIEWSSDLDGILHTEAADEQGVTRFTINTLSEGEHTISLKVTDSDDLISTASINLTIKQLPNAVTLEPIVVTNDGLVLN